jgi:flagellar hook-basal body complex protein FliE
MTDPLMNSTIGHIQPLMPNSILKPENLEKLYGEEKTSFSKVLKDSIQSINNLQQNANNQVEKLAKGEIKDVHQVMIAMQEASLTFKMMMKVRSQILAAYKEISRPQ